jgi:hypothetical protein
MISLALSLALASSGICNPLPKCNLELEARVGIGQLLGFQPARLLHSQLSRSQTNRVTGIRTTCENGLFRAFRQVGNYSITTRQRVQKNSSEDALLAVLLALKSFAKCPGNTQKKWMPRWPVRAVGCTHFAPPTQRTRRDSLVHCRSVPLPVALGGDDYASAPPAAPSSSTDRLSISLSLNPLDLKCGHSALEIRVHF